MESTSQLTLDLVQTSKMDNLMKFQAGRLHFSSILLEDVHKLPSNPLKVRRSEFKKGKSKNYAHHTGKTDDGRDIVWYDAMTLPKAIFIKYNLPSLKEASQNFSKQVQMKIIQETESEFDEKGKSDEAILQYIAVTLTLALNRASIFKYIFLESLEFAHIADSLSQKYSVLNAAVNNVKYKQIRTIKGLFHVLQSEQFKHLKFPDSLEAFYAYFQRASQAEDLIKFVKGKWNVRQNARKINETVLELICYYAAHPNGSISNENVRIWVNTMLMGFPKINGKKLLKIRSIDDYVINYKNKIDSYRDTEYNARKRFACYINLSSAEKPMDQFFLDEWHIIMKCNVSGKSKRKIVLGMMDGRSGMLVMHKIVEKLNSQVIKEFLHDVIKACRFQMPAELVCDFASYNVCHEIRRLFDYLVHKYKSRFHWSVSSNANRKVEIERFWGLFGSMFISPILGSVATSITATRERAHPAKVLNLFLNDPAFLHDEYTADKIISHLLHRYNRTGVDRNRMSPIEIYREESHANALKLEPVDLAYLHGTFEQRDLRRSQVQIDGKDYKCFDLDDVTEMGNQVDCYQYQDFPNLVFVFKKGSYQLIGEFQYYEEVNKAKVNQTAEDRRRLTELSTKQKNQIERISDRKKIGLRKIMQATGNVNPGEVGALTIDMTLPPRITSVLHLNVDAKERIEVNPWELPDRKKAKKARGKNQKNQNAVSPNGLLEDTVKVRYANNDKS